MASQKDVFAAIADEREYQDHKWGTIEQHPHSVAEWVLVLEKKVNDAKREWVSGSGNVGVLFEVLKVAGVAVACLEQHGIVQRPMTVKTDFSRLSDDEIETVRKRMEKDDHDAYEMYRIQAERVEDWEYPSESALGEPEPFATDDAEDFDDDIGDYV